MASEPGPSSTTEGYATGGSPGTSLYERRDYLINMHSAHKGRVRVSTTIANGDWHVVWPDLAMAPEAPTVANLVEMGINHWTSIGGAMLPSVRSPVDATADKSQSKRGARKRERRVRELWDKSNISELSALFWGDYAGTGCAIVGAWVNFEEKDRSKRNPYIMRFDPRHTYPLKDNQGNIAELLVARVLTKAELAARYPQHKHLFSKSREEAVEEWFWFTPEKFQHIVADASKEGRKSGAGVVLMSEENPLGFVPAWEIVRPTYDGQRRGVFDQTIHLLKTMHRLMTLTIYSTEEMVFPPIVEYDIVEPDKFGPGRILSARSAEGRLERVAPTSNFDVKDLIARLGEEGRNQAAWPQQLSGNPGASIVSARGIAASMGQLDARLALAHKQFELAFGKVSGFLLALDEKFCNAERSIYGDQQDRREAEIYNPERDVAGNWRVVCTYGLGAGSDPASKEMRLAMHTGNMMLSKETGREQLDFLDDPHIEPLRMLREMMRDAIAMGAAQQASQGDPSMAAMIFSKIQKEDVDIDEVMEGIVKEMMQPPEPPPGGGMPGGMPPGMPGGDGGAGALQQAESLARGGIPGNAEQAPDPGAMMMGAGLPPLAGLMNQDSKQVI